MMIINQQTSHKVTLFQANRKVFLLSSSENCNFVADSLSRGALT